MQSQEELLNRPPPPPLRFDDDSGLVAPDLEPRLTGAPTPQPTPLDTRPRIDRTHQLPAARIETFPPESAPDVTPAAALARDEGSLDEGTNARPASPGIEDSREPVPETTQPVELAPVESAEEVSGGFNDPLQPLMKALTDTPIFDEPDVTAPASASGDRDLIPRQLMGVADERPALSDLLEGMDETATDEGEVEEVAAAEASAEHDAIFERLMGGGDEYSAISALQEGEPQAAADLPKIENAPQETEASQPSSAASSTLSLLELLDGLGASQPPKASESLEAPANTVRIGELGEGTLDFSNELMLSTLLAERAWDEAAPGSGGSAESRAEWRPHKPAPQYRVAPVGVWDMLNLFASGKPAGPGGSFVTAGARRLTVEPGFSDMGQALQIEGLEDGIEAAAGTVSATAPSLPPSMPSFGLQPIPGGGPSAAMSPMSELPEMIEMIEIDEAAWRPEDSSTQALAPSGGVVPPDAGTIFAASTSVTYALRAIDWTADQSTTPKPQFDDTCEVEPIVAGQEPVFPTEGCRIPRFTVERDEQWYQGITLAGIISSVTPESHRIAPDVPRYSEELIPASSDCRVPGMRLESLSVESYCRGLTLSEMVSWAYLETMAEQGLPVFANWTDAGQQPGKVIGIPAALLSGAIRSIRRFPRFGSLLKSVAGEALMQGFEPSDTAGILPVLGLDEKESQPQPFAVLELESDETDLDAIGPAAAVYAPADLDPCEYA